MELRLVEGRPRILEVFRGTCPSPKCWPALKHQACNIATGPKVKCSNWPTEFLVWTPSVLAETRSDLLFHLLSNNQLQQPAVRGRRLTVRWDARSDRFLLCQTVAAKAVRSQSDLPTTREFVGTVRKRLSRHPGHTIEFDSGLDVQPRVRVQARGRRHQARGR